MDDLISREDVKRLTTKRNSIWNEVTDAEGRGLDEILDSLPTIDAVQVARCKDCTCWDTGWCSNNDIRTGPDDYCSMAERKES